MATTAMMFAAIPSLPRAELARLTERMINRMDELDGDADLEVTREDDEPEEDRCPAADDGCGPAYDGYGNVVWGTVDEVPGVLQPIYGIDQSAGPTNMGPANTEHHARMAGLVRSPTGGWTMEKRHD